MRFSRYLLIYRQPVILAGVFLLVLSISRLLLVATHWDRVGPTDGLGFIFIQGLRFDLILLGMLLGPVFVFKPWFHLSARLRRLSAWLTPMYVGVVLSLAFLIEASTLSFIDQYDSRPNYLFVEYLAYPREVFAMLSGAYLKQLIGIFAVTLFLFWVVVRWLRKDPENSSPVPLWFCAVASPLTIIIVFAMIRSTMDHRPVNPSVAVFSQDAMVNQLPLNSPYSLFYAIYENRRDSDKKSVRYGVMEDTEVIDTINQQAGISDSDLVNPEIPSLHHQKATRRSDKPMNLVIILQESLGAEFVGSLGGKDLTPEIDKLSEQGIWLEQLYATGTRSVRGIEAVISGFVPTPRRSVVKLAETQTNFFTVASLLQKHGYETSFIYGGAAHFDNMKRFFLNNGFETIIEEKDYQNPVYQASWGVSDEDLLTRAHQLFEETDDQPFFSLVFTSSNHEPFDIPENRVIAESGEDGARETAVKYADYAVGQFFDLARKSSYWDNTVFLVIADHNSRVYGEQLVPIERFHIPGVILGGDIQPRKISGITSQIDMLPTLLSLIGIDSIHPGIGRDLTLPQYADGAGRAMMQFNALQAYIENHTVVVLQPNLAPQTFDMNEAGKLVLIPEGDAEMEQKALAYSLWGPLMIKMKTYHD
jgi:phosphoglycerol transferase MdoB-like AlkP superfamily enzyme